MEISFQACQPHDHDAKCIMQWRNDPQTLAMSFHSNPKKWPDFLTEYQHTYFANLDLPPLFAIQNNQKIAFIRQVAITSPLKNKGLTTDISINIAPEFRGKGLGRKILENHCNYLLANSKVELLLAEIKTTNEASIKTFLKAGYVYLDEYEKYVEDINTYFPIIRLIKPIRPNALTNDNHPPN